MKKKIECNETDLIGSLQEALAHAQDNLTLKTAPIPPRTRAMSAAEIARIRRQLNASTPIFAAYLNVSPDTVRKWEKRLRHPSGPALRLL